VATLAEIGLGVEVDAEHPVILMHTPRPPR
jgi:hypothetical protein